MFNSQKATLLPLLNHVLSTVNSGINADCGTVALIFQLGRVAFISQKSKLPRQKIARLLFRLLACAKRLGLMEGDEGKLLERE